MASVQLRKVWLHDAANPVNRHEFWSNRPADDRDYGGEVRTMANGRRRIITNAQRSQTLPITLVDVTDSQLEWLESFAGRLVMYRDPKGRLLFCTFFTLGVEEYRDFNYEVTLTLQEVTYSIEAESTSPLEFLSLS